jgi:Flp pilus assembly protein TadG
MRRTKHPGTGEAGTALIELALLTPILLWFSLGALDLGKMFRASQLLQNAAREGARLAILPQNQGNTAPSLARINSYLTVENSSGCGSNPIATVNQELPILMPSGVTATASQVTVQCPFNVMFLHGLSAGVFPKTVNLAGQATFRNFY